MKKKSKKRSLCKGKGSRGSFSPIALAQHINIEALVENTELKNDIELQKDRLKLQSLVIDVHKAAYQLSKTINDIKHKDFDKRFKMLQFGTFLLGVGCLLFGGLYYLT